MATIERLIERIETRIGLVSGLDIQIHAEDRLVEQLRHKYNVLSDDLWIIDYMQFGTYTLDGTTGHITSNLTSVIRKFTDIHSIYHGSDEVPLPRIPLGTNPSLFRRKGYLPSGSAQTLFTVYPIDTVGDVHVWSRSRLDPAVWETPAYGTEVPMDEELLILGTVYDFIVDDGANKDQENKYLNMFNGRLAQIRQLDMAPIPKRPSDRFGVPSEWY